jgi:hypothetical protein
MTFKANVAAEILVNDLLLRLAPLGALAVVKAFDVDGQPLVKIGTQAALSASATLKIVSEATIQKDALGLTQNVYHPHRIQVIYEDVSATGVKPLSDIQKLLILGEVIMKGHRVDLFVTATAVAPTIANIPANPVGSYTPDLWNPLTNQG